MADGTVILGLIAVLTNSVAGDAVQCVPDELHLSKGTVRASSADRDVQEGDIFYRDCSDPAYRQYIGWRPDPSDTNPTVQIDLPNVTAVFGIVFQTSVAQCDDPTINYSLEPFLMDFDLHFVLPIDNAGNLVLYQKNMKAMDGKAAEHQVTFVEPIMTKTLVIKIGQYNMYPGFRFKIIGCEAQGLCDPDFCLNGGVCVGKNFCKCGPGYLGDRCNQTINDIDAYDYGFEEITDNTLITPDAVFDVIGDVTLNQDRRRDHGHHSCHFHSSHHHHSYCQFNPHQHGHNHHNHHDDHDDHDDHSSSSSSSSSSSGSSSGGSSIVNSHCMSGLTNQHHGFTTSMNAMFNHGHNGNCHLFSNGGNLQNHQGASLSYNTYTSTFQFHVNTNSHSWTVNAPWPFQTGIFNNIAASWHPNTGAQLHLNNQLLGSCGFGTPHTTPHDLSVDLRIADGHVSLDINANVNISINGLNMIPTSAARLQSAGATGPFTAAPPPTQPTTTTTTTTTTPAPVTATTTVSGGARTSATSTASTASTTPGPHRPVCYVYDNQPSIGAVKTSTRCNVGEVCTLFEDKSGFTAECLPKSLCESGKAVAGGKCFECCDTYLCNDHCSASTSSQCADKPTCATLMNIGYDVCQDGLMAADICQKTCNIC